jgi:predicted NACHT family NTPase
LVDPDGEYGTALNPNVVPWESISSTACLVLLGEPGIGKSEAMKAEVERLRIACQTTQDTVMAVDLRGYQSDQRLHERVFESATIQAWIKGESRLYLFLDGMDEGLMRFENLGLALLNEFTDLPVDRLSLRVACRTAMWPRNLDAEFQVLWGAEQVRVYELAPLRRVDIIEAARVNSIEPPTLLIDEIFRQNIVPLAIKPITLQFLLNIRCRHAGMPSTQTELYADGCRLLCEERRSGLRPSSGAAEKSAEQRLAVAARIAAITIFCAHDAVWTEVDRGDVPDADICIADLAGGDVGQDSARTNVDTSAIWQALNTGLFSSRGLPRIGWAHQAYAEFLAAEFLVDSELAPDRMMSLLLGADGKVVPQLRETAAWLACLVPDVFRWIVHTDPMTLLGSDAGTSNLSDRRELAASVLSLFENGQLLDLGWDLWRRYPKLNHPQLDEQLRPYVTGKDKGPVVRRVVMMIAQTCEIASLQAEIVTVSLDETEDHELRVSAAFAISQYGTAGYKRMLRPLAIAPGTDDPNDDLRGCGLICSWPESITATELFNALRSPKQANRTGLYETFLLKDIVASVEPEDLPVALSWTQTELGCQDSLSPFSRIGDEIRARALGFMNLPDVAGKLAEAAWHWLTTVSIYASRHDKFKERLTAEENLRRELILRVVEFAAAQQNLTFHLCHGLLISAEDYFWILEQHRHAADEGKRKIWLDLIRRTFRQSDIRHKDALIEASKVDDVLAAEFSWFLDPSSPAAEALRQHLAAWDSATPKIAMPLPLDPPASQRVQTCLAQIEAGDVTRFIKLNDELTLSPESTRYSQEYVWEMALTALPGWKNADDKIRHRIVAAAKQYLLQHSPGDRIGWVATESFPWDMLAGYRALLLLLNAEPEFVDKLSSGTWERWASITLAYPLASDDQKAVRLPLLRKCYASVPDVIFETLGMLIDKENQKFRTLFVLQRIEPIWDASISSYLMAKLNPKVLELGAFAALLKTLIAHGADGARERAQACIGSFQSPDDDDRERAVAAARAVVTEADDAGWTIVWPAIQCVAEFGLRVFEGIGGLWEAKHSSIGKKLSDEQLSDLYIWMAVNVPQVDESGKHGGFSVVTSSQSLGWFRDSLLTQLKGRGTRTACAGLRRAVQELPQYPRLSWHLMEAEQIARAASWTPLEAGELLTLVANSEYQLVQSGEQLSEILIQSLKRLEQEMQGETPSGFVLWDQVDKTSFRPKNELRISDYIKLHFERDIKARGIVVNREVEIRKGMGASPGEITDIHVDAIVKGAMGAFDRISVIVEVKGCWNPDVLTAMEAQLAERYLKDNACAYGLYVVAWFVCDQWRDEPRKSATPTMSLDDARAYFAKQATDLSNDVRSVAALVANFALR